MLEYNERTTQRIKLNDSELKEVFRRTFKSDENVSTLVPLTNGAVNTTYKFMRNGEPFVLRIYIRDPLLCEIESQIIQLVSSQVLIPQLVYSDKTGSPYPFAVFRFMEGKHLFEIADESLAQEISFELGTTLAKIHQIKFDKAGLFGPGLIFNPLFEEGSSPYYQYIKDHLIEGSEVWKRLGDSCAEKVLGFIDQYEDYFPLIGNRGVLVHSDFKPVNLLWNKDGGVTVLDWEFAHSGEGLMDFAILLRHFYDFPLHTTSLEKGYNQGGCILPEGWIKRARITDIINIVQLLDSPAERPKLYDGLLRSLMLTIDNWDELEKIIIEGRK